MQTLNQEASMPLHEDFCRALYDSHFYRIRNFLNNLIKDRDIASDIATDTYLSTLRSAQRFESIQNAAKYWFICARNAALKTLLQKRIHTIDPSLLGDREAGDYNYFLLLEKQNRVTRLLQKLFDRLPVSQRAVIKMRYLQGWSIASIAAETGLTKGTVEVTLTRARQNLEKIAANWRTEYESIMLILSILLLIIFKKM